MSLLEVQNLTKRYGNRTAVDSIGFSMQGGEVVGFLGPNGAGKTTTMRMIAGLIHPSNGKVQLQGQNVPGPNLREMGAMIEEPSFYPYLNGLENLRYAAKMHGAVGENKIQEVLNMVGLTSRAKDTVRKYSQGMRQRLGLARALLANPKLLLLDEPANGLDPEGVADLRHTIRNLGQQGVAILLSSHILAEVEKTVDRILIINKGKLLRDAPMHQFSQGLSNLDVQYSLRTSEATRASDVLRREPHISNLQALTDEVKFSLPQSGAYRLAPMLVSAGIPFTELRRETTSSNTVEDLETLYLEVVQQNTGGTKNA